MFPMSKELLFSNMPSSSKCVPKTFMEQITWMKFDEMDEIGL
jgi:hypothetical protein